MSINNLGTFLEEFKKKLLKQHDFKKTITAVLEKYTKGQECFFSVQNDVIFIKTSPSVKQSIYLQKQKILEEIKTQTMQNFSDIR